MSQSSRSAWNRIAGLIVGVLVVGLVILAMNAGFRTWWTDKQEDVVADRKEKVEPRDRAAERKEREERGERALGLRDEDGGPLPEAPPPPSMRAPVPEPDASLAPMARVAPGAGRAASLGSRYERQARRGRLYSPGSPDNRERYPEADDNEARLVSEHPVSTFSVDVDTASYSLMRTYLEDGTLPPRQGIRVEELINYFNYDYPLPEDRTQPFKPTVHIAPAPWNEERQLLRIGIKGFDIEPDELPAANLVFLIDVSGSMSPENKLPLVKKTLRMLTEEMKEGDSVAIVVYSGAAGTVLEPTSDKAAVLAALDKLKAGGSTAGGEGIRQAYALAERGFDKDKVNRVILATDGDFNVGITDDDRLEDFVAEKRKTGIFLTVLTYGTGNLNARLTQKLAQAGNGNAAYIDKLTEARKVMVEEMRSTLFPIAKDVKIQVEFNPAKVAAYRLIGYETRMLKREDFELDTVDAGDIGSGHSVTAIYEIYPPGTELVKPLRYGDDNDKEDAGEATSGQSGEFAFLRMRYKLPDEDKSRLIERPIVSADVIDELSAAPEDLRFAVAVAAFGQRLRGSKYLGAFDFDDVLALAAGAKGEDPFGYRAEFVQLVRLAKSAGATPELHGWLDGPAQPIIRVPPQFPPCAEEKSGKATVEFVVETDGTVQDVKTVSSTSECFGKAAESAVRRWRYRPRVENGQPVRSKPVRVTIEFVLDEDEES